MLPYKRSKRVGDLLRREIADIVMNKMKDPRLGFVTITSVEVTDDLKTARVYVSVLEKTETENVLTALNSAQGFIKRELGKRIRLKILPKVEFFNDKTIEYGSKIDELLRKLE
jgi:ribosome-binding factor A